MDQYEPATGSADADRRYDGGSSRPACCVVRPGEGHHVWRLFGVAGTDVDLGQTPLGMSVRAGAPKPDISTVDGFKKALLRASSVTFPMSTTGIYLVNKVFPQLGIGREMAGKVTATGVTAVAKGDAEIAVQPVSELLHASGVDFVGTIPAEIQFVSVFSAAIVTGSKEPEASKRLIGFLRSEKAQAAIKNSGMEPLKSR